MSGVCRACGTNPCAGSDTGCNRAPFKWGFDGCMLHAKVNGVSVKPLNLCEWLYCHQTDTSMRLVPSGDDSYIEYKSELDINGCGGVKTNPERIYVCDLLSLGKLTCLGDVAHKTPKNCDLLVYNPCCGDKGCEACEGSDNINKWTPYTIPEAGDCELEADAEGYYHVLVKDKKCGCIRECRIKNTSDTYQYVLRDSIPNDPDWPFKYGNYNEDIPLRLSEAVPQIFGKTDLEVRIEYGFGTGHPDNSPLVNTRSVVVPQFDGGIVDSFNDAIVIQATATYPWGSWEGQASRTILVPRGKNVTLKHEVRNRSLSSKAGFYYHASDGQEYNGGGGAVNNFSRLHALKVTVKPARTHIINLR